MMKATDLAQAKSYFNRELNYGRFRLSQEQCEAYQIAMQAIDTVIEGILLAKKFKKERKMLDSGGII